MTNEIKRWVIVDKEGKEQEMYNTYYLSKSARSAWNQFYRNQSMGSSIKEFYQEYTNKGYKAVEKIYREVEEWKWKKD